MPPNALERHKCLSQVHDTAWIIRSASFNPALRQESPCLSTMARGASLHGIQVWPMAVQNPWLGPVDIVLNQTLRRPTADIMGQINMPLHHGANQLATPRQCVQTKL